MEENNIKLEARVNGAPWRYNCGFDMPVQVEKVEFLSGISYVDMEKFREELSKTKVISYFPGGSSPIILPIFEGDRIRAHGNKNGMCETFSHGENDICIRATVIELLDEQGNIRATY